VDVPLWRTVAVVGVSGSGKTSLAMGTLYAEGMQRLLKSLSTYKRRRLTQRPTGRANALRHYTDSSLRQAGWPAVGRRRIQRRRDEPGQVSHDSAQVAEGLGVQRRRQSPVQFAGGDPAAAKCSRNWAETRSRSTSETRMLSPISCPRFLG